MINKIMIDKMDNEAKSIIADEYYDIPANFYIVWKCKILKNWKYLISTDINDGLYYELTFDGDKNCWYVDTYKKCKNEVRKVIPFNQEPNK